VVVVFVSIIIYNENEPTIEYFFLDEHLSKVTIKSPWFTYIDNFLAACKLPLDLNPKEQ
jgi:hypothetical protein